MGFTRLHVKNRLSCSLLEWQGLWSISVISMYLPRTNSLSPFSYPDCLECHEATIILLSDSIELTPSVSLQTFSSIQESQISYMHKPCHEISFIRLYISIYISRRFCMRGHLVFHTLGFNNRSYFTLTSSFHSLYSSTQTIAINLLFHALTIWGMPGVAIFFPSRGPDSDDIATYTETHTSRASKQT